MPPEGSFMHWFLTNTQLHLFTTLGVLSTLVLGIWYQDFLHATPYLPLLPPNSLLLSHPITFVSRWWEVYRMHVDYTSRQTAEKRKRKVEDVGKRGEYMKAHGFEQGEGVFGGWTARGEGELLGPGMREGGGLGPRGAAPEAAVAQNAVPVAQEAVVEDGEGFVDFEGKRQPVRTKWLGIW
ncbi:hypothetical protein LTR53_015034 [Teratosphaeriaceae sp. CCFEE 6253]|nr:hypothetical protein LTR53_015034 [Teratosphaeriaceae sp. CCFEE 6253]